MIFEAEFFLAERAADPRQGCEVNCLSFFTHPLDVGSELQNELGAKGNRALREKQGDEAYDCTNR